MSNTNEVWLDIPEYEDEYQVSSLGRVLRKKTNEMIFCLLKLFIIVPQREGIFL